MRHFVGLKEMAPSGADFFLLDRTVINALGKFGEKNTSLLSLISWMGFRQNSITYNKQKRAYGKSGWTLQKKLKLVADSITAFSYTPIRLISWFGACTLLVGLASLGGDWWLKNSPLYFPILICISGLQMLMMGVMGEYLWRTFDESRRRPSYLIEEATHPVLLSFFEE
jgi:dolichol-phosphate mannosyltransferase